MTRWIAFTVDAALINLAALIVSVSVGLALSVLDPSNSVEKAALVVGGVAYVVWTIAYFVTFWSTTGQTPGNRLLQIRVCRAATARRSVRGNRCCASGRWCFARFRCSPASCRFSSTTAAGGCTT